MKRIVFLDWIRIIACFLVMLVHACEGYYAISGDEDPLGPRSFLATEADRMWVALYDGVSRLAVPLFMIVSAYLLVPMKEGQTAVEFYRKRAQRILLPFFIFLIIYSIFPMFAGWTDLDSSLHALSRIGLNFPAIAGHLWFMYPLIGLYLFIPMISPWLSKVSAKEERIFIWLFAASTLMPYLNHWFGYVWGEAFWNDFHTLWYFSGYLGYLVIAHYIRVHLDWDQRKRIILGGTMFITGALWTILSFYIQAVPGVDHPTMQLEIGWSFCTINVMLLSIGAFLLFTCIKKETASPFVTHLSNLTYGMYLMHMLWLFFWFNLLKNSFLLPSGITIPLSAIITFISSYLTCCLLEYLPGGKWVIGTASGKKQPGCKHVEIA